MRLPARGGALVYVLVFLTLLSFFGVRAAELAMRRTMTVEKGLAQQQGILDGRGLAARLNDCLLEVTDKTCNARTLAACGFPAELRGRRLEVRLRWVTGHGGGIAEGFCQVKLRSR